MDLRWLLTGQAAASAAVPSDHPVLQRAAALLAKHPDAAAALAAFLDILARASQFPPKESRGAAAEAEATRAGQGAAQEPQAAWIPVLGRTAAGVPHFWSEQADTAGLTVLSDLVARHASRAARQTRPAVALGQEAADSPTVQVITLTEPDSDDLVEFVSAEALKARYPDAFALRIDGDSMAPDIQHGDLAILSPSVPAADNHAAVTQLAGQIGVTCKLYRRVGDVVHLVPINEQFRPVDAPADQVIWALRVLALVRS